MKALVTLGMVVDLDAEEIPGFAAEIERKALESMYDGMEQARDGRDFDEQQIAELRERFQMYGVSYSVLHELEIEV